MKAPEADVTPDNTESTSPDTADAPLVGGDEAPEEGNTDNPLVSGEDEPGAVEKYDRIDLPEGVEVDEVTVSEVISVAKELGLTKEQATALATKQADIFKKKDEGILATMKEIRKNWVEELKADKDFGGQRMTDTIREANKVVARFGDDALKKYLKSGVGDNPSVVKLLARVGKALGEHRVVEGEPAEEKLNPAYRLYPTMRR